jgi:hypothetical protein
LDRPAGRPGLGPVLRTGGDFMTWQRAFEMVMWVLIIAVLVGLVLKVYG